MNKRNEKGFTLIELMIVVAIVGILAAIAIPRFMQMANPEQNPRHYKYVISWKDSNTIGGVGCNSYTSDTCGISIPLPNSESKIFKCVQNAQIEENKQQKD